VGAEGIGIIISESQASISKILNAAELEEGIKIGGRLNLAEISNLVNKKFRPSLIHDATEGGLYGALSELLHETDVGIELREEPQIHPILQKLSDWLEFDPYRIISSGLVIFAVSKDRTTELLKFLSEYEISCSEIGSVTSEREILRLGDRIIDKPRGDDIIIALRNLERIKNE